MPHLTTAQWNEQLDACRGDLSREQILDLIYKESPNALWSGVTKKLHIGTEFSNYRYFTSFFSHKVWPDWTGIDVLGKVYHSAYLPIDFSMFKEKTAGCGIGVDDCRTDFCEIPQGGISSLSPIRMFETGWKTKPLCIANIRTNGQVRDMAKNIIEERFQVDEVVMETFYTMALINMLGNKWILEYTTDAQGNVIPIPSNDPRNLMRGFRYAYRQSLFPQVGDLNNVLPLGLDLLDVYGSTLTTTRNKFYSARGPRNEPIFELWVGDDWYRNEVYENKEYIERLKYTMPMKLLPGYTLESGDAEIIGNFKIRYMPNLPRFTESTDGGLTIVQPMIQVPVDQGYEAIPNPAYAEAPFLMTLQVTPQIGEILTRPDLTEGIEGRPILPITGKGDWVYRNPYDKECNPQENMPWFEKRYEMGFRMLEPDAGGGFIHRAKGFRLRPVQTCNLRPIVKAAPNSSDCTILTIGCNPNKEKVDNNIIGGGARKVICSGVTCGGNGLFQRITIKKESADGIAPNLNPLGTCVCGDSISLYLNNETTGEAVGYTTGTIIEVFRPNVINPNWSAIVQLPGALADGQCIAAAACQEGVTEITAVHLNQVEDDIIKVILSHTLPCAQSAGADANIEWFDKDGVSLGDEDVTIDSFNPDTNSYVLSADGLTIDGGNEGVCKVVVTCA